MNEQVCPYLGILSPNTEQQPARDYPSFENCCFAESTPAHGSLLLADQSTYCLSGGNHQCPRFQALSLPLFRNASAPHDDFTLDPMAAESFALPTTSIPLDSEYLTSAVDVPDYRVEEDYAADEEDDEGPNAVWLLAGTTFATVFLIGIGLALYLGWRLISTSAMATTGSALTINNSGGSNLENSVITLANVGEAEEPIYVVFTATPDPALMGSTNPNDTAGSSPNIDSSGSASGNSIAAANNAVEVSELAIVSEPPTATTIPVAALQPSDENQGQIQQNFPVAVTPTPIVVSAGNNAVADGSQIVSPQDVSGPADNVNVPPTPIPSPTPVPEINVQVLVPSAPVRRDTPEVPIVSNVDEIPTETPTPTATWPPPIVFFSSEDEVLLEGKCTNIFWEVQNVRAVYVASLGVDGKGEKEVCIKDKDKEFDLAVVLPDGSVENHFTTVMVATQTPVPTPTWTFTPLPEPTPTWTPVPPTPTAIPTEAPPVARGARLDTSQPQGSSPISCAPGTSCEVGLLATNTGDGIDSLVIIVAQRTESAWQALLCRQDGVCSGDRLVLTNVGQANTAFITFRLQVPADAESQNASYSLYAASEESGETVRSELLVLDVSIP